jgi:uncharacterized iron-regulated membrane protein
MNPAEEARPRAADHVWFDRRSGQLLAVAETASEPAGTRLLGWVLPVHTGQAWGTGGRILMVCIGLAALTLLVSGLWSAFTRATPVRK